MKFSIPIFPTGFGRVVAINLMFLFGLLISAYHALDLFDLEKLFKCQVLLFMITPFLLIPSLCAMMGYRYARTILQYVFAANISIISILLFAKHLGVNIPEEISGPETVNFYLLSILLSTCGIILLRTKAVGEFVEILERND